jgi:hypothetical protein
MAMSMITREPPGAGVPKRLARLSVLQYEAMVDSGVFTKRDRFTLVNGLLVAEVPKSPRRTFVTKNLARELQAMVASGWDIRVEDAVRLDDSKPEPDISIARGEIEDYADRDPGPADLAMVVEVAGSSVTENRHMARVYGRAGILVFWIVNMKAREVEVYTRLKRRGPSGYSKPRIYAAGQSVPVVIDGEEVGRTPVADIVPRIAPAPGGDSGS